jgi:hypothetical protein
MKGRPLGAVLAGAMSLGTRALGLFLFAVLMARHRGDPRAIAALAGLALAIGLVLWWML